MKVAVLSGGMSLERDISLAAGKSCTEALQSLGYDAYEVDAATDLTYVLAEQKPDAVFNALHGRWGEDGCLQGLLEWLRIPYTHSGVLASALAMDKQRCKLAYAAAGVPSPASIMVNRKDIMAEHVIPRPYIVKPHNEGSSLGGYYLVDVGDMPADISETDRGNFMVEEFIPGHELTATVLGDRVLGVSEFDIGKWYDFNSKYALSASNRILPARLPKDIYDRCCELAQLAHDVIGCRGISRTDFRWDESKGEDGIFALETNTQPGLRPNSNAGEQAAYAGISFPELCDILIKDASLDR
ncbi:D-alanine--D-alanine ligase [Yoonia sp. GPGPB17]|uniref:D-alanine--D-alanine ligase n=1 Tax=Yoonia sp. GPGPB17 TaxID=3026147 RepID=UPI0030C3C32D